MDWTEFNKGIFLLNVLGIIYNAEKRQILIGKRERDPYIPELSWCFPGGRADYTNDLESGLKKQIKEKTGLEVTVKKIVFAKTYPEKREFVSVYYHCEILGGEAKPGGSITELKWVKPIEVEKYFTTSLHPEVLAYLKTLE